MSIIKLYKQGARVEKVTGSYVLISANHTGRHKWRAALFPFGCEQDLSPLKGGTILLFLPFALGILLMGLTAIPLSICLCLEFLSAVLAVPLVNLLICQSCGHLVGSIHRRPSALHRWQYRITSGRPVRVPIPSPEKGHPGRAVPPAWVWPGEPVARPGDRSRLRRLGRGPALS
jgi:hypothetical protein